MQTTTVSYLLSGTVKNQGLAVSAVRIRLYESQPNALPQGSQTDDCLVAEQITGVRGEFEFAVAPGDYIIDALPQSNTRFLHQSKEVSVTESDTTCAINLSAGFIIEGNLRTSSGVPITAGEIVALGIEPSSYRAKGTVDGEGDFAITLPRAKYHIGVRCNEPTEDADASASEQTITATGTSSAFVATAISVYEVLRDEYVQMRIPDFVTFQGEVADASGRPVVGARVTVTPSDPDDAVLIRELELSASCQTDGQGKFKIAVHPGRYNVHVEPSAGSLLFAVSEANLLIEEDLRHRIQLGEGFRLRGQVLCGDEAMPRCSVRVHGIDKKVEFTTHSDRRGQFSVGVPAGNYKVTVNANPKDALSLSPVNEELQGLAPWSRVIVVGGDTHVAIRLQNGTPVCGTVLGQDGRPRAGVRVAIFGDTGKEFEHTSVEQALVTCTTDSDGGYCEFVSPGVYWLVVHTDFANPTKVEVDKEPVEQDIKAHGWSIGTFELTSTDGRPIPRCRVIYAPYGTPEQEVDQIATNDEADSSRGYGVTNDDGKCRLIIPSGVYTLRFLPPPNSSFEPKTIKQISIALDVAKTIKLASC